MTSLTPLQASSTLVNVAENAEGHLIELLAQSAPKNLMSDTFVKDCEKYIADQDAASLVRALLKNQGAIIALVAMNPPEEALGAFYILASLLDRISDRKVQRTLAEELADVLANKYEKGDPLKRLGMLTALYNLRKDGGEKAKLIGYIVELAARHQPSLLKEDTAIGGVFLESETLVKYMDFWDVPTLERRALYTTIVNSMKVVEDKTHRRQKLLLLLLDSYGTQTELTDEMKSFAIEAATGAVQDPLTLISEQRHMMRMAPIVALQNDSSTQSLYKLLEIFAEGKLDDYMTFETSVTNTDFFAKYNLNKEECIRSIRLLSLCSLASEHEEIPYDAIASTLQLDNSDKEVENWVIEAVSSGLLEAKMDQTSRRVLIEYCIVRKFGIEQWKILSQKLGGWKTNIASVLDGLKQASASTPPQEPLVVTAGQ